MKMMFMLFTVSSAQLFNHDLRYLPEKQRQLQIQGEVDQQYERIHNQIIRDATENNTKTSFTLFCVEPNLREDQYVLYSKDAYRLKRRIRSDDVNEFPVSSSNKIYPKPECSVNDGYELWSRQNGHEYHKDIERHPLYYKKLHDHRVYIKRIFKKLEHDFPDIHITISDNRPSYKGIFKNDCCPLYILRW